MHKAVAYITDRCPECYFLRFRPNATMALDFSLLQMEHFKSFAEPVGLSLSTVPGILVGNGGTYLH